MSPRHVVIVGYDQITSLDLSGPLEAFTNALLQNSAGKPVPGYKVTIAALGAKTFCSESGMRVTAHCTLSSLGQVDTLIIPGGAGMRNPTTGAKLARWIKPRV